MTDRSRHQSNQKTGNARRGNANAGIQAGNNFRNLPLNNAINKIAKTVTKVGTTSVNQVSKPKVDNLPKINTSNVPKSPLERLGLENRAFSGGFNYNVKDFQGKTSGTAGGFHLPSFVKPTPHTNKHRQGLSENPYVTGGAHGVLSKGNKDKQVSSELNFNKGKPGYDDRGVTTAVFDSKTGFYVNSLTGESLNVKQATAKEYQDYQLTGKHSKQYKDYMKLIEQVISGKFSCGLEDDALNKWYKDNFISVNRYVVDEKGNGSIQSVPVLKPNAEMPPIKFAYNDVKVYNKWFKKNVESVGTDRYGNPLYMIKAGAEPAPEMSEYSQDDFEDAWKYYVSYQTYENKDAAALTEKMDYTAGWKKDSADTLADCVSNYFASYDSDKPSNAKATVNFFKDLRSVTKQYFWNPLVHGDCGTALMNVLVNLDDTCDLIDKGYRAAQSSEVVVKYAHDKMFDNQKVWLYSGSFGEGINSAKTQKLIEKYKGVPLDDIDPKIRDKVAKYRATEKIQNQLMDLDGEIILDSDKHEDFEIKNAWNKIASYDKKHGTDLTSEMKKMVLEWHNAKKLDDPFGRIKDAYTTYETYDYNAHLGNKAADVTLETLGYFVNSPTLVASLGTSGVAKSVSTAFIRNTLKGIDDEFIKANRVMQSVPANINGKATHINLQMPNINRNRVSPILSFEDTYKATTSAIGRDIHSLSAAKKDMHAELAANRLINRGIITPSQKDLYKKTFKAGLDDLTSSKAMNIISASHYADVVANGIDSALLKASFALPYSTFKAATTVKKLLRKNEDIANFITNMRYRRMKSSEELYKKISNINGDASILDYPEFIKGFEETDPTIKDTPEFSSEAFTKYKNSITKQIARVSNAVETFRATKGSKSLAERIDILNATVAGIVESKTGVVCTTFDEFSALIEHMRSENAKLDINSIYRDRMNELFDRFTEVLNRAKKEIDLSEASDLTELKNKIMSASTDEELKQAYVDLSIVNNRLGADDSFEYLIKARYKQLHPESNNITTFLEECEFWSQKEAKATSSLEVDDLNINPSQKVLPSSMKDLSSSVRDAISTNLKIISKGRDSAIARLIHFVDDNPDCSPTELCELVRKACVSWDEKHTFYEDIRLGKLNDLVIYNRSLSIARQLEILKAGGKELYNFPSKSGLKVEATHLTSSQEAELKRLNSVSANTRREQFYKENLKVLTEQYAEQRRVLVSNLKENGMFDDYKIMKQFFDNAAKDLEVRDALDNLFRKLREATIVADSRATVYQLQMNRFKMFELITGDPRMSSFLDDLLNADSALGTIVVNKESFFQTLCDANPELYPSVGYIKNCLDSLSDNAQSFQSAINFAEQVRSIEGLPKDMYYLLMDNVLGLSSRNPKKYLLSTSRDISKMISNFQVSADSVFGQVRLSLDKFRTSLLDIHYPDKELLGKHYDDVKADLEAYPDGSGFLMQRFRKFCSGGHSNPEKDVNVQVLQLLMRDPEIITKLNAEAVDKPIIFFDLETHGLNSDIDAISQIAIKRWVPGVIDEDSSIYALMNYIENTMEAKSYQTKLTREELSSIRGDKLRLHFKDDKSIDLNDDVMLFEKYCEEFEAKEFSDVFDEKMMLEQLFKDLDNYYVSFNSEVPILISHSSNKFDAKFLTNRCDTNSVRPAILQDYNAVIRRGKDTFTYLKNKCERHQIFLTEVQKKEVADAMVTFANSLPENKYNLEFLNFGKLLDSYRVIRGIFDSNSFKNEIRKIDNGTEALKHTYRIRDRILRDTDWQISEYKLNKKESASFIKAIHDELPERYDRLLEQAEWSEPIDYYKPLRPGMWERGSRARVSEEHTKAWLDSYIRNLKSGNFGLSGEDGFELAPVNSYVKNRMMHATDLDLTKAKISAIRFKYFNGEDVSIPEMLAEMQRQIIDEYPVASKKSYTQADNRVPKKRIYEHQNLVKRLNNILAELEDYDDLKYFSNVMIDYKESLKAYKKQELQLLYKIWDEDIPAGSVAFEQYYGRYKNVRKNIQILEHKIERYAYLKKQYNYLNTRISNLEKKYKGLSRTNINDFEASLKAFEDNPTAYLDFRASDYKVLRDSYELLQQYRNDPDSLSADFTTEYDLFNSTGLDHGLLEQYYRRLAHTMEYWDEPYSEVVSYTILREDGEPVLYRKRYDEVYGTDEFEPVDLAEFADDPEFMRIYERNLDTFNRTVTRRVVDKYPGLETSLRNEHAARIRTGRTYGKSVSDLVQPFYDDMSRTFQDEAFPDGFDFKYRHRGTKKVGMSRADLEYTNKIITQAESKPLKHANIQHYEPLKSGMHNAYLGLDYFIKNIELRGEIVPENYIVLDSTLPNIPAVKRQHNMQNKGYKLSFSSAMQALRETITHYKEVDVPKATVNANGIVGYKNAISDSDLVTFADETRGLVPDRTAFDDLPLAVQDTLDAFEHIVLDMSPERNANITISQYKRLRDIAEDLYKAVDNLSPYPYRLGKRDNFELPSLKDARNAEAKFSKIYKELSDLYSEVYPSNAISKSVVYRYKDGETLLAPKNPDRAFSSSTLDSIVELSNRIKYISENIDYNNPREVIDRFGGIFNNVNTTKMPRSLLSNIDSIHGIALYLEEFKELPKNTVLVTKYKETLIKFSNYLDYFVRHIDDETVRRSDMRVWFDNHMRELYDDFYDIYLDVTKIKEIDPLDEIMDVPLVNQYLKPMRDYFLSDKANKQFNDLLGLSKEVEQAERSFKCSYITVDEGKTLGSMLETPNYTPDLIKDINQAKNGNPYVATVGSKKVMNGALESKYFEVGDYPAYVREARNNFATHVDNKIASIKVSKVIESFKEDWIKIIALIRNDASSLRAFDSNSFLRDLKIPETPVEAYAVCQVLYDIYYSKLANKKAFIENNKRALLGKVPDRYRMSVDYNILNPNLKYFDSSSISDEALAILKGDEASGHDLIYTGKEYYDYTAQLYEVNSLKNRLTLLCNITRNEQLSDSFDAWKVKCDSEFVNQRDVSIASALNYSTDCYNILDGLKLSKPELYDRVVEAARKIESDRRRVFSNQIMKYISTSEDNLISHLLFHNQLLVIPLHGDSSHLKYLNKLTDILNRKPKHIVTTLDSSDNFLFISLDIDSKIYIKNGSKYVDEDTIMSIGDDSRDFRAPVYDHIGYASITDEVLKDTKVSPVDVEYYLKRLDENVKASYSQVNYFTDGATQGSLCVPYTKDRHLKIRNQLPVGFISKITKESITIDDMLWNKSQFDFTCLGDMEHCYKDGTRIENDLFLSLAQTTREAVGTVSTSRMYISNFFDSDSHCRLERVLPKEEYSLAEKLQILKDSPDQCVITLVPAPSKTGFNVKKLRITDELSIREAEAMNAIVVPYDMYIEMASVINTSAVSKTYMKVWAKIMFFMKVAHLCNPGTWLRNWIDGTLKSAGETGSLGSTAKHQLTAMKLLFDYNKIVKEVRNERGLYRGSVKDISNNWEAIKAKTKTNMSFEQFKFMEGWLKNSISGGESQILKGIFNYQNNSIYRNVNLRQGSTSSQKGIRSLRETKDLIESNIIKFEEFSDDEIRSLISEGKRNHSGVAYTYRANEVFNSGLTEEEFWKVLEARRLGQPIDNVVFKKYAATSDNLLRIRNRRINKTPKEFRSQIDHMCSMMLTPMSKIEQVVRLGQFLALEEQGYTRSQIFKSITDSQFNYELKSSKVKGAEFIMSYFNFEYNNMLYWCTKLEKDPQMLMMLEKLWMGLSWRASESYYENEDVYNNPSIAYMMQHGGVPIFGDGMYLKVNPSAFSALNWIYGMPSQYLTSVIPPIATLSKEFLSLMGGQYSEILSNLDYSYSDKSTFTKILEDTPVLGTIYNRYYKHFTDTQPWERIDGSISQQSLVKWAPTIFGAVYRYNRRYEDEFDVFQEKLAEQGKWYDCNRGKVVPLSQKNEEGLNNPKLSWEEKKEAMFLYKGLVWDSNQLRYVDYKRKTGKFTTLGEMLKNSDGHLGLNRYFDFRGNPDDWDEYCALKKKYQGLVWDNNQRKFVFPWQVIPGMLNRDNLTWEESCYYHEKLFGTVWDSNQGRFVDKDRYYIPGGLNEWDRLSWTERNKLMLCLFGKVYDYDKDTGKWGYVQRYKPLVKFEIPDDDNQVKKIIDSKTGKARYELIPYYVPSKNEYVFNGNKINDMTTIWRLLHDDNLDLDNILSKYGRHWQSYHSRYHKNGWINFAPRVQNKRYSGGTVGIGSRAFSKSYSFDHSTTQLRMAITGEKYYDDFYKFQYSYGYNYSSTANPRSNLKRFGLASRNYRITADTFPTQFKWAWYKR